MPTDAELLSRYTTSKDGDAFAELARRYLPLVYGSARRRVRDPALADDICQAVFWVLAQKAKTLHTRQPLADWLLTVTRYTASNALRQRARRAHHEAAAAQPEHAMPDADPDTLDRETWDRHLDAALDRLPAIYRRALLLRYYDEADFPAIAKALKISEPAARKRVARAVIKLRESFARQHVGISLTAITSGLASGWAVQPSPALTASIATAAASIHVGRAAVLAKGALHAMFTAKLKAALVVAIVLMTIIAPGVGFVAFALAQAPIPATQQLKPITGWLKIANRGSADAKNWFECYEEPGTGRQVIMTIDGSAVHQFVDPMRSICGEWFSKGDEFVIGAGNGGDIVADRLYLESALIASMQHWQGSARMRVQSDDPNGERITEAAFERGQLPENQRASGPTRFLIHAEAATGLVNKVIASGLPDGKPDYDTMIVTRVAAPPMDFDHPEALPRPAGSTLVDNRPTPNIQRFLDRLTAAVDGGLGRDVVVTKHFAGSATGEFEPRLDEMTICAGSAKRYFIGTWPIGEWALNGSQQKLAFAERPAHFPEPSFEDAIAAATKARPTRYLVYDGKTLWASDYYHGLAQFGVEKLWRDFSTGATFWGAIAQPSLQTTLSLTNENGDWPVLTARTFMRQMRAANTPDAEPVSVVRLKLGSSNSLFPYSLVKVNHLSGDPAAGGDVNTTQFGGTPAYTFRDGLQVPNHWRTLQDLISDGNSLVPYETLVPADEGKGMPAAWYGDPAKTWP